MFVCLLAWDPWLWAVKGVVGRGREAGGGGQWEGGGGREAGVGGLVVVVVER
jgi:hypothetical protein